MTRYKSFWCSNTQLILLLAAMRELLETGWDWDYVMNISGHLSSSNIFSYSNIFFTESDFPVRPLAELERHLAAWHGGNFVALDAGPGLRLHEGQGLRHLFHNCDGHMFRIGQRYVNEEINITHFISPRLAWHWP